MEKTIIVYIYENEAYSEREAETFAAERISNEISNGEILDTILNRVNIDMFELFSTGNYQILDQACEAFAEAKQELIRDWIDDNMYRSFIEIEI